MPTLNGSPIPIEDILAHAKKGLFFTGTRPGFSPLLSHFLRFTSTFHFSLFTFYDSRFTTQHPGFIPANLPLADSPRFSYLPTYSKGIEAKHIYGGMKSNE